MSETASHHHKMFQSSLLPGKLPTKKSKKLKQYHYDAYLSVNTDSFKYGFSLSLVAQAAMGRLYFWNMVSH